MKMKKKKGMQEHAFPLLAGAVGLLVLIVLAGVFRTPSAGLAIETPQFQALNLDQNSSVDLDARKVTTIKIQMRPSQEVAVHTYQADLTLGKQYLTYQLREVDEAGNFQGDVLGRGVLNNSFPAAGPLYLNDDPVPDLSFSYSSNIFRITNLNYVAPDASTLTLFQPKGVTDEVERMEARKIVPLVKDQALTLLVNVSSSKTPAVRALWNGTTVAAGSEWTELQQGLKHRLFRLSFTPSEERPYVLVVESTVDTQVTRKTFVFSVNDVVYRLTDPLYPEVLIRLRNQDTGAGEVTMITKGTSLQPFSLACTQQVDLPASFSALSIAVLYSYNAETQLPQQLKPGTVSEITNLQQQKGYALKIPDANPLQVTVSCPVQPASSALNLPQGLKPGWNLVAISGYVSVPLSELEQKAPPTKAITDIFELQNGGASLGLKVDGRVVGGDLDPGKAYWVYVQ